MRKFLLKIICFILIFFLLSILMIKAIPVNKKNYLYQQRIKIERLKSLKSPRLILLGGSNLAFGLDSKRLEDSLKINVQNMGLHGGIGLKFMMANATPYLKDGDTVIIMPEFGYFFNDYEGQKNELATVFFNSEFWPLNEINFNQFLMILEGTPKYLYNNYSNWRSDIKRDGWSYSSENFNEWGDEAAHREAVISQREIAVSGYKSPVSRNYVNDFAKKVGQLRIKGCVVYVCWPIAAESYYNVNEGKLIELESALNEAGIYFSNGRGDFSLPDSMRFDTNYHMNGKGVEEATRRFINLYRELRGGND